MTVQTSLSVLVIGIPEHLNQYTEEVKKIIPLSRL